MEYSDIQRELAKPFPIEYLEFRPGDRGMALTYVEWTHYLDRLDEVAPGQWSISSLVVSHTAVGEDSKGRPAVSQVVQVTITIAGVSQVANSDLKSPTSAYAQAVKRAATIHGLGRYLYNAPKLENAYQGYDLKVDPRVLIAACYKAWGFELPEGFTVPSGDFIGRLEQAARAETQRNTRSTSSSKSTDQNPDQHKGKLTAKQCGKLYSIGLTDADIWQMTTVDAREAVSLAFEGEDADAIRDRFIRAW